MGRRVGHHARKVRRAARRRRADRTRPTRRFGQHPGAHRTRMARRQHRHRRCRRGAGGGRRASGVVLGSGGTAPAAVAGLAAVGVEHVTVVARNPDKAARLLELAATLGMGARYCALDDDALPGCVAESAVVVSTLPADIAARYADTIAPCAAAAGRDLRPVAHAAGVGGDRGGRPRGQRSADAAVPGLLAGRTIHRAARAARADGGRARLACAGVRCGPVLAVAVWLVTLTAVDVREHRLPNALTLPGAALILAGAVAAGRGLPALVGALALTGGYLRGAPAVAGGDGRRRRETGARPGRAGRGVRGGRVDAGRPSGAPLLTALWGLLSRRRGAAARPGHVRGHRGSPSCLAISVESLTGAERRSDRTEIARI